MRGERLRQDNVHRVLLVDHRLAVEADAWVRRQLVAHGILQVR